MHDHRARSDTSRSIRARAPLGLGGEIAVTMAAGVALILALSLSGAVPPAGAMAHRQLWLEVVLLYLLAGAGVAILLRRSYPHDRLGGCNIVTFLRMALVVALLAPLLAGQGAGWAAGAIGALALALDGVDGWMARRSGLASRFGARFDMEVDAALALVLSLHLVVGTATGPGVLLLGAMRYLFIAAGAVWPWLRAPLPQRFRRKAVCVVQLAALIALQAPQLAIGLAWGAVAALTWSFALDVIWLHRHRAAPGARVPGR